MNILNMVIAILMYFLPFICQRHSILHQTKATLNNYVNQTQVTSLMTSVLQRYIAEYTDTNSWHYPIRCRVTFTSALEYFLSQVYSRVWIPNWCSKLKFTSNHFSTHSQGMFQQLTLHIYSVEQIRRVFDDSTLIKVRIYAIKIVWKRN